MFAHICPIVYETCNIFPHDCLIVLFGLSQSSETITGGDLGNWPKSLNPLIFLSSGLLCNGKSSENFKISEKAGKQLQHFVKKKKSNNSHTCSKNPEKQNKLFGVR